MEREGWIRSKSAVREGRRGGAFRVGITEGKGGGTEREMRANGLPCRMSKRGGEEAELHQMK